MAKVADANAVVDQLVRHIEVGKFPKVQIGMFIGSYGAYNCDSKLMPFGILGIPNSIVQ